MGFPLRFTITRSPLYATLAIRSENIFLASTTLTLSIIVPHDPNPDKPVEAKRKSRFIGEAKFIVISYSFIPYAVSGKRLRSSYWDPWTG